MDITRRQLLKAVPALAASALLPASVFAAGAPARRYITGSLNRFCMFDIAKGETLVNIELPFYPHSFIQHPRNPNRIWMSQRYNYDLRKGGHTIINAPYTSRAVEVDIEQGGITKVIEAEKGTVFTGHALFMPDSDTIFFSHVKLDDSKGYLTGYDSKTGKMVSSNAVTQAGAHECQVTKDGTAFVATSGTKMTFNEKNEMGYERLAKSGMAHYDLKKEKLLSFTPIEEEEQLLGHFGILNDGTIIATAVQTRYKQNIAPLAYIGREGDKSLKPMPYNEAVPSYDKPGELFSVVTCGDTGMAVATSLSNNYVILIDGKKGELVAKVDFAAPWGVVFDKARNEFIVSGEAYMGIIGAGFDRVQKIKLNPNGVTKHFSSGHSLMI